MVLTNHVNIGFANIANAKEQIKLTSGNTQTHPQRLSTAMASVVIIGLSSVLLSGCSPNLSLPIGFLLGKSREYSPPKSAAPSSGQTQPQLSDWQANCENMGAPESFCREWQKEVRDHYSEWSAAINELGTVNPKLPHQLSPLSLPVRRKLGLHTPPDWSAEQQQLLNQLNLSSKAADDLADEEFHLLFPQRLRRPISKSEWMTAQIWWAIREEELTGLLRRNQSRSSI